MNLEVQYIRDRTNFSGYVIVDWDGVFTKTTCPNSAVAEALDRTRTGGAGLAEFVRVFEIGMMGIYHHTPGERYAREFDWQRALTELMC